METSLRFMSRLAVLHAGNLYLLFSQAPKKYSTLIERRRPLNITINNSSGTRIGVLSAHALD